MTAPTFDEARRKMTAIRESLRREVETIRTSPKYSNEGRLAEIAKTTLAHRRQAESLRNGYTIDNDKARAQVTRKIFGLPPGADANATLAYRDAVDRVADLRAPKQLEDTLKRANAMGDDLLARAAAARAHELGIRSVVEEYAETSGLSDDYDDLRAKPTNQLANAALFGVPTPAELRGAIGEVSDNHLESIAAGKV
jgi:hypothetical protein